MSVFMGKPNIMVRRRARCYCAILSCLLAAMMAAWVCVPERAAATSPMSVHPLPDGHSLYNLVDLFLRYAEAGQGKDDHQKAVLWDRMIQSRHPDFFNQVIYRNMTGTQRARYKKMVIHRFWEEIRPKLDALKASNRDAVRRLISGREKFNSRFPNFDPQCDYYLTVSFSFHGKVVDLNGRNILAIGLENFAPNSPELDITIAHEQFHLHHFKTFSASGGLYRGVWAEGLAVYASEVLVPGHRRRQYLGFSIQRMNEIYDSFDRLKAELLKNLGNSDKRVKRAWLGMEDNRLNVPPGAGYYLGEQLIHFLVQNGRSIQELTSMESDRVFQTMRAAIPLVERDM